MKTTPPHGPSHGQLRLSFPLRRYTRSGLPLPRRNFRIGRQPTIRCNGQKLHLRCADCADVDFTVRRTAPR